MYKFHKSQFFSSVGKYIQFQRFQFFCVGQLTIPEVPVILWIICTNPEAPGVLLVNMYNQLFYGQLVTVVLWANMYNCRNPHFPMGDMYNSRSPSCSVGNKYNSRSQLFLWAKMYNSRSPSCSMANVPIQKSHFLSHLSRSLSCLVGKLITGPVQMSQLFYGQTCCTILGVPVVLWANFVVQFQKSTLLLADVHFQLSQLFCGQTFVVQFLLFCEQISVTFATDVQSNLSL